MENSIHQSQAICNGLKRENFCCVLHHIAIKHILAIISAMFLRGYKGKTVDFARCSENHRTTIAHFLNHGKWADDEVETILRAAVIRNVYEEAKRTGKPVFVIVDDTISSKAKPSSQAAHPIEDAYFHQSHLKKKQDYGHQAVAVMLSCNGITLNYAIMLYDKSKTKIQMVCDIAEELPVPPVPSYFLCDCWYTTEKVMDAFIKKGFYTLGALKTNRILYPAGIRVKLSEFALHLRKTDSAVRLVTVDKRQYYVYRYEGALNGVEDAAVMLCYPRGAFHKPKTLRAFLCTNPDLKTEEALEIYTIRWEIEVYFRQCKNKLALDKYQIRSGIGVRRYWLLMSLAHFICCTGTGHYTSFEVGYAYFQEQIRAETITFIYRCGASGTPLETVLAHIT